MLQGGVVVDRYKTEQPDKPVKDWAKSKTFRDLRKDLLDDLESRGLCGSHFVDKVDEYMRLWVIGRQLNDDIQQNGVVIPYKNGQNQFGTTDNKSVNALVRVSAQMLQIWRALGFVDQAVSQPTDSGGDDDEL